MGNVGWSELLVIGIVALIVVGPKDLPVMFHTLGRFMAKIRSLGREFSRAMDDAARDAGVKDVANDIRNVTSPKALGLDKMQEAARKFEAWDPMKPAAKPVTPRGPAVAAIAAEQEARRAKLAEEAAAKATLRASEAPLVDLPAPPSETKPAKTPKAKPVKAAAAPEKAPPKPRGRAKAKPPETPT